MQVLGSIFTLQHVVNVLDVLVVWYVIYVLMMLLRGTKAVQLFKGVVVIIVVKLISWYVGLETLSWIMDQVINWGIIAIIVIFQPEIRRGLEHLGRGSLFTSYNKKENNEEKMVEALDQAIQYMSKRRIGALITIQMNTGLEDYIETGIKLDANITGALLINIFIPNTPLHDGAVIIKDCSCRRISAAFRKQPDSKGTRNKTPCGRWHQRSYGCVDDCRFRRNRRRDDYEEQRTDSRSCSSGLSQAVEKRACSKGRRQEAVLF